MFRDENVCAKTFRDKFEVLKKKLDAKEEIQLDSEYHQYLKRYIERVYTLTCCVEMFDDSMFNDVREAEMSNLNRLQKLKNGTNYKKDKHKAKRAQEDWG